MLVYTILYVSFDVKLYAYTSDTYVGVKLLWDMHMLSFTMFKVLVPIYKSTNSKCNFNHIIVYIYKHI